MNKKKLQKGVLISSVLMMIIHLLEVDYDSLTNLKVNLSPYMGVLSMALIAIAMYFSIREDQKIEK